MSRVCRSRLVITCLVIAACAEPISPTAKVVTITPRLATMVLGDSVQLAAAVRSATGVPVTWKTSADSVLTVSAAGLVRAVGPGTAVVTATVGFASDTMHVAVTVRFARLAMSYGGIVCAVATTGDAFCRGANYYGQLGNGSTTDSPDFVRVSGGHRFATVLPGVESTCGLTTDSLAYCWGYGGVGALGVGDTNRRMVPTPVAGGHRFSRLGVGELHACGLTGSGAAYCWGWNGYGQAGVSTGADPTTPQPVQQAPAFGVLGAGGLGTCAITPANAATCWGMNYSGQLGSYTDTIFHSPVLLAGGHTFSSLGIREMQCGVATTGTVYCWGQPWSLSPVAIVSTQRFTTISTAYTHGCGVATDSTAQCWSWSMQPTVVPGGLKFTQLASGNYHDCGLTADSSAHCWLFHCGTDLDVGCDQPPAPALLPGSPKFTQLSAGGNNQACGLDGSGAIFCWYVERDFVVAPVAVSGGVTFRSIAVGNVGPPPPIPTGWDYGCGIATDSTAQCWGFKFAVVGGQFTVTTAAPSAVPGGLKYVSLDTWGGHVCGIVVGGAAYCWTPPDAGPVAVPGGGFVRVFTDFWSDCAIDAGGLVSCWGRNLTGELGVGSAGNQSRVPAPVLGGHTFTSISPTLDHTCGITTDSTAYCWGSNSTGMLGTGDTTWSIPPVPVVGGLHFAALATGPYLSCGLVADGSAYCWGRGSLTPAQQQVGTHFISLSANSYSTICGVTTAGAVQCWDAGPYLRAASRRGRL